MTEIRSHNWVYYTCIDQDLKIDFIQMFKREFKKLYYIEKFYETGTID